MTHAVIRTSPHGQKFVGRCSKCGETGLGMGAALIDCPADDVVSDAQALLEILGGVSSGKDETDGQLLARLGTDASKWAAEFRKVALSLGYSDMDEGWLIGWFANAIEQARATRPQEAPDAGMKDLAERTQSAWEDGRKAGVIEAMNAAQTQRDRLAAKLADAEAKVAGLREALDMAKRHMIVNDLSLPNVFEVIDAAPAAAEGAKG